jgi:hypothetical protein
MTQSSPIPSDERIVDAMIPVARAAKSHRVVVAGSNSSDVFRELHRRGFTRATTTKHCRVPRGQFDMALVSWREHSIKALATTLGWLVHFLSATGILVVWIGPHERMPIQSLSLVLGELGFCIALGTVCENGVAISARRLEPTPATKVA